LQARAVNLLPPTKETVAKALALYEQAVASDPNSVLALAGAVDAVLGVYFYNMDTMPLEAAMPQALQYLERARALEPNAESVLVAQSSALDFQEGGLDYQRAFAGLKTVGQKLIDLYPNNPVGYFRLGCSGETRGDTRRLRLILHKISGSIRAVPSSKTSTGTWPFAPSWPAMTGKQSIGLAGLRVPKVAYPLGGPCGWT
jgi:hypothetical protein